VEFVTGLACAFRGLGRLVVTPSLWAFAIAPVVVSAAVLGVTGWLVYEALADQLRSWAQEHLGGALATSVAFGIVFWAGFAVAVFFVFEGVVRVVAAPFLVYLADRTVAEISGAPAPAGPGGPFVRWVVRPVVEALVALGIRIATLHLALPLLFVPVAGGYIFTVFMMGLLGLDLLDIAQSARGVRLADRLRFGTRHVGACLGLGIGAGLLLLVPCVNVLLLPAVVVAGVLLDERIAPDFPRRAAA
jgi:CysZ protein